MGAPWEPHGAPWGPPWAPLGPYEAPWGPPGPLALQALKCIYGVAASLYGIRFPDQATGKPPWIRKEDFHRLLHTVRGAAVKEWGTYTGPQGPEAIGNQSGEQGSRGAGP